MASGHVAVDVSGDQRTVELMIQGMDRAFSPAAITTNLLADRVYDILEKRAANRFSNEGDDVSGAWAALKPYTVEKRGSAHPINVRTGAMKNHILQREPDAMPNSLGGTLWFPKRGGAKKTQEKIKTAQQGSASPHPTVPRPVLGVNAQDMELILLAVSLHLAQFQPGGGMGLG